MGRRKCEVGVYIGKVAKLKKKATYFDLKNSNYYRGIFFTSRHLISTYVDAIA